METLFNGKCVGLISKTVFNLISQSYYITNHYYSMKALDKKGKRLFFINIKIYSRLIVLISFS